jgi:D-alanyl-D-alanine dipeptidase
VDVTSPGERWQSAATFSHLLSDAARANRRILIDALAEAGFSNCRDEWWHWSYGDSAWAVRVGAGTAIYGLVAPPEGYSYVPK